MIIDQHEYHSNIIVFGCLKLCCIWEKIMSLFDSFSVTEIKTGVYDAAPADTKMGKNNGCHVWFCKPTQPYFYVDVRQCI